MESGSESDSDRMDLDLDDDPTPLLLGNIGGEERPSTAVRKKGSCDRTKSRWIARLKQTSQDLADIFPGTQVVLFIHYTPPKTKVPKFFGKGYGEKACKFLNETDLGKEIKNKIKVTARTWPIPTGLHQETLEHEEEEQSPEDDMDVEESQLPKISPQASKIVAEGLAKSRENKKRKEERLAILEARRKQNKVHERRQTKSRPKNTSSRAKKAAEQVIVASIVPDLRISLGTHEMMDGVIPPAENLVNAAEPFKVTSPTNTNSVTVKSSSDVSTTASPVSSEPVKVTQMGSTNTNSVRDESSVDVSTASPVSSGPVKVTKTSTKNTNSVSVKSSSAVSTTASHVSSGPVKVTKMSPKNINSVPFKSSVDVSATSHGSSGPVKVTTMSPKTTNIVTVASCSTEVPAIASLVFSGADRKSDQASSPKMKCYNFLAKILSLSKKQPGPVIATNIQLLIQSLVDGKVVAEEFYTNLQKEFGLNIKLGNPIPFLKNTLPELRHSLAKRELNLEGIIPPNIPPNPVNSIGPVKVTDMSSRNTNSISVESTSTEASATASLVSCRPFKVSTMSPTNINSVTVESSAEVSATAIPVFCGAVGKSDQVSSSKLKCYNFLSHVLSLAKEKPGSNVCSLIQHLIDGKDTPEEFFSKLQTEFGQLNPGQMIPFLAKYLPDLKKSLATNEMILDGVIPPAFSMLKNTNNQPKITPSVHLVNSSELVKLTTITRNTDSVTVESCPAQVTTTAVPVSSGSAGKSDLVASSPKMKCYNFLAKILSLSKKQPGPVIATNIQLLIQSLVDGKVVAEEFYTNLQKEFGLNIKLGNPIPFLKNTLPELRHSLAKGELKLEGITPPNISPGFPVNFSSSANQISPTFKKNAVQRQAVRRPFSNLINTASPNNHQSMPSN